MSQILSNREKTSRLNAPVAARPYSGQMSLMRRLVFSALPSILLLIFSYLPLQAQYGPLADSISTSTGFVPVGGNSMKLTKNGDATVQYLDRAFAICREFPYRFHTEARGDIWYRRLNVLAESGKLEQAVADAEEMVKNEKKESHTPKPIIPDPLYDAVNPYIFYSLRFLAEHKHKEGKTAEACKLLAEAYDYFPLSAAGVRDVNKAKATEDPEEQYKAWEFCLSLQYLPWEKQPIVKLRD